VQVIFFGGGWVFFLKKLFRDYEVSNEAFKCSLSVTFWVYFASYSITLKNVLRQEKSCSANNKNQIFKQTLDIHRFEQLIGIQWTQCWKVWLDFVNIWRPLLGHFKTFSGEIW